VQKIRKFVPTVLFACLVHVAFSQDSTSVEDKSEKKIQYTPYYSVEKLKSLGNYVGLMDDSTQFRLSAGISVFNTLWGFIPNSGVENYAPNASLTSALLVVDGTPYPQTVGAFYNFNAFDYVSLTFLSRGNAASVYGVSGANGGIVLQTKTGENYHEPVVEFNSYMTLGWSDVPPSRFSPEQKTYTQWHLSNSIAYMQDFGKIDTRVSYNFVHTPAPNVGPNQHSNKHNFKINTAFDIRPKFNVRLILDKFFSIAKFDNPSLYIPAYTSSADRDFMQANLILKYKLTSWLQLSSQASLLSMSYQSEGIMGTSDSKTNRFLTNVFLSADKSITSKFSVTSFLGIQYEQTNASMETKPVLRSLSTENHTSSVLGGVGFNVSDYLFANLNYRQDILSVFPADENNKRTYSISAAFVFSDAFHLNSPFFSSGKIRGSVGKTYADSDDDYSYILPAASKNLNELGGDLFFFNNKVSFTFNYFNESSEIILPNSIPAAGYVSSLLSLGDLRRKGTEIILGATALKNRNLSYQIYLLGMRSKHTIEKIDSNIPPNPNNPPDPNNILLSNLEPSWRGSLLNRVTYKHLMFSILVDMRQGGTVIESNFGSGSVGLTSYDGTQLKLRDISLGYQFSRSLFNKIGVERTQLSASGRNLALLYSASGKDAENAQFFLQKSASLSLSLFF
jgi:hypothetical protein